MPILLDSFPDDAIVRQLVSIDGIEPVPRRSNERRWRVILRPLKSNIVTTHTVSADYLYLLSLGSLWREKRKIGDSKNLPQVQEFLLNDPSPHTVWRTDTLNGYPKFLDATVSKEDITSRFPAYQLIHGNDSDGHPVILCVSASEIIRFYVGRAPAFSRHLFEFREMLQNPRLYRFLGDNFFHGTPEKIEIADKNLGIEGRRLLVSMLSNQVGKKQLRSVSRTARAAIARNRSSSGKLNRVFPIFGLPHKADCSLTVIGSYRNIYIRNDTQDQVVQVFAVTRITMTGHVPLEQNMTIMSIGGLTKSDPIPGLPKRKNAHDDVPHDAPEPSNSDVEILTQMGEDTEEEYSGLDGIKINDEVELRDDVKSSFFENPDGSLTPIDKYSTERGGDTGGKTGQARGRDTDAPPAIQKSLLLVDPSLPNLMLCEPEIELGPQDVIGVDYERVPDRLKLLAACISKTRAGLGPEWRKGFFGGQRSDPNVPLLDLRRFEGEKPLPKTGKHRRALVADLNNDTHRILFADIERKESENIGIFTLLIPININIEWCNVSYILQYRLLNGTWPNANTHGGGYIAKVHKHRSFYQDDHLLGRLIKNFVLRLEDQVNYISA